MRNKFEGIGRVIFFKYKTAEEAKTKSSVLQVSVSVYTGEKLKDKAEGEYDPSQIFQMSLWAKLADALQDKIYTGQQVMFTGDLDLPNVYEKDGETRVNQQMLRVDDFLLLERGGGEAKGGSKGKATATTTKKTTTRTTAPVDDELTIPDDPSDFNFD